MAAKKSAVDPRAALKHKGLATLEKISPTLPAPSPKEADAAAARARAREEARQRAERPDREVLRDAMHGVVPLADRSGVRPKGRVVAAPAIPHAGTSHRRKSAVGGETLKLSRTPDGGWQGARGAGAFALEMLGRLHSPEEELDLHRHDVATARLRVEEFVRTRRARGLRTLRIVHGRGTHAPDGTSLLADVTAHALSEPPASASVDAFRSEPAADGGAPGAILVALRPGGR